MTGDYSHPMMKLQRMDLADESWPRHAAIVLFIGELSHRRYPQLAAHATVFKTEDRHDFLDDKVFEGNAFYLFERIIKFAQLHIPLSSTIRSGETVRADRPVIPSLVLREAILNAITHREYQETSPIQLRLFPDRLELWNPGSIPQELIEQPGISRPRNPDIARVLYLRGLVEMRGVGMLRMRDEMAALNLPEPHWENRSGGTQVTIPFTAAAARETEQAAAEAEARALSERAFAYLADAQRGNRITREEYQEHYARYVAERSARNDLKRLVEFGYLRQVGAGSQTAYIRTDKTAPTL
jgi:ATP-dependent DNA helicase RecG